MVARDEYYPQIIHEELILMSTWCSTTKQVLESNFHDLFDKKFFDKDILGKEISVGKSILYLNSLLVVHPLTVRRNKEILRG